MWQRLTPQRKRAARELSDPLITLYNDGQLGDYAGL